MADSSLMDLKEFVRTTLVQVVEGVAEASKTVQERPDLNAHINPSEAGTRYTASQLVSFDVAVTTVSGGTGGGGASIKVAGVSIGGEGKRTSAIESLSRVQFAVPVALPATSVPMGDLPIEYVDPDH